MTTVWAGPRNPQATPRAAKGDTPMLPGSSGALTRLDGSVVAREHLEVLISAAQIEAQIIVRAEAKTVDDEDVSA